MPTAEEKAKAFQEQHADAFNFITQAATAVGDTAGHARGKTEGAESERARFKALNDKFGAKEGGAAFVTEQFAAGKDVNAAAVAWTDVLEKRLEAQGKRQANANAAHPETTTEAVAQGGAAIAGGASTAIQQFEAAVAQNVKAGMGQAKAVSAVVKANPQLAEDYREAKVEQAAQVKRDRIANLT